MRIAHHVAAALVAVAALAADARPALAADPVVQATQEVSAPGSGGRMLLVYGTTLTKVQAWELTESDGTPISALTVVFKGKTLTGLALPASLVPPTYTLPGTFNLKLTTRAGTSTVSVAITGGRVADGSVGSASLASSLRTDLDAAVTADVAAEAVHAADADHADTADVALALSGTIPASAFSAYDDLAAESKIGTGAAQVAAGNHNHDSVYPLRTDLNTPGTVNNAGNPVEWSKIKGIPAGFADGLDDGGGGGSITAGAGLLLSGGVMSVSFSGSGSAANVSRSDHDHNATYYTQTQLNASGGTINTLSNPMDWSRLKGVPAGIADGTDDNTTYSAGTGLVLTSGTFAADFGTAAGKIAAGNHTHSTYLDLSGGSVSGQLQVDDSSNAAILATSGNTSSSQGGIDGTTSGGIGVAGHGDIGVYGDLDGDGSYGVMGRANYPGQTAVYALATNNYATGLQVYTGGYSSTGVDIRNQGGGYALRAYTYGYYRTVAYLQGNYGTTGLRVRVGNSGTVLSGYAGNYGTGLQLSSGYYGRALRANVGRGGLAVYTYTGNYGIGAYFRGANYTTGMRTYVGYRGTGIQVGAGYNGTAIRGYITGQSSYGLVMGTYAKTANLAVFRFNGYNNARIDFSGKGYFNGGTQNYGADFAESVKTEQPRDAYEPGDVMVIDVSAPRQFARSRQAESTLVAGVVSTNPAVLGSLHKVAKGKNNGTRDEVPLGIVGIVPTKVCDEGGPIRIGDLLVTSSVPGHAKRAPASPAVGTVLGKALGALDRGNGKIEVLLIAR